jgi:hypothetical protein
LEARDAWNQKVNKYIICKESADYMLTSRLEWIILISIARENPQVTDQTIHPFEKAGLGVAPFRFVGMEENVIRHPNGTMQAGGTCQYCGTGIRYMFQVKSADGKLFHVGCDCIMKIESKGTKLYLDTEKAMKKMQKEHSKQKLESRIANVTSILESDAALLTNLPHPNDYMAKKSLTLRDSITWLLAHAGDAGKLRACKAIERAVN